MAMPRAVPPLLGRKYPEPPAMPRQPRPITRCKSCGSSDFVWRVTGLTCTYCRGLA